MTVLSLLLGTGYYMGEDTNTTTFLKGLTLLEHFWIHWTTGIFFGILICFAYLLITKHRLSESWVLAAAIFLSHFPDIRFVFRHKPHDWWEIIFLFHTVVDEVFWLVWVFVCASVLLGVLYVRTLYSYETAGK